MKKKLMQWLWPWQGNASSNQPTPSIIASGGNGSAFVVPSTFTVSVSSTSGPIVPTNVMMGVGSSFFGNNTGGTNNTAIGKTNTKTLYIVVEKGYEYNDSTFDPNFLRDEQLGFTRIQSAAFDECVRLQQKRIQELGSDLIWYITDAQRAFIYNTVTKQHDLSMLPYNEYPQFFEVVEINDVEYNKVFYTVPKYIP